MQHLGHKQAILERTFLLRAAKALDPALALSTLSLQPSTCATARSVMASSGCMLSASIIALSVLRNISTCETGSQGAPSRRLTHGQSCQACTKQAL